MTGHIFLVARTQRVYRQYLVGRGQGLIPYNAHNSLHHKNYLPQILMMLVGEFTLCSLLCELTLNIFLSDNEIQCLPHMTKLA